MSKAATISTLHKVHNLLGITESYQAPEKMMEMISGEVPKDFYLAMLKAFDHDLGLEWFNDYFEDEHADRKNNHQDFTPTSVSRLMAETLGKQEQKGIIYEPAAGTGSTIIQHWRGKRLKRAPWDYSPLETLYVCEELSSKTIPFLLFNLLIRGMNAVVIHGDTLTRQALDVYHCFNETNDAMGFSSLMKLEHSERVENMFGIKFVRNIENSREEE